MVNIIAAMDEKKGIGKNNSIPWRISGDFKHFKEITMGHPIIMGRRTFESLGRVLPGRTHIIITHNLENKTEVPDVFWVDSLESAIDLAKNKEGNDEIFIIGGGQIFEEALEKDLVERLYLTIIEGDYGADTFFPDYVNAGFKVEKEEVREEGKYKFKFVSLEK